MAVQENNTARYFADWVLELQVDLLRVGSIDRDLVIHYQPGFRASRPPWRKKPSPATSRNPAPEAGGGAKRPAVVVLSPDGAVRAMVGGKDYADSQFNRATQALRQPGSAFKPFVYMAAVENGLKPDDVVTDAPIRIGHWQPHNFTGKYEGPVSVETAPGRSLNTATVRIAQDVGAKAIVAAAHRMGMTASWSFKAPSSPWLWARGK